VPVLRFKPERLLEATGIDSLDRLSDILFRLKCEVEEIEDRVEVEVNPDRPDMYMLEGIARAVRGLAGYERGWRRPRVRDSGLRLRVEAPRTRPYIAAAAIYNYHVDEDTLEELIQFQEKLHDTIGRRRRKIAIGLHDLDKLPSPQLEYKMLSLDARFKPLGLDIDVEARWVLDNMEQGIKYGGISIDGGMHPFILSGGVIVTMPPVINSDITRMEPGTSNLFIDVTGVEKRTVLQVLDVIVSTLAYRRGVEVGVVEIEGMPWNRTPMLSTELMKVSVGRLNSILGSNVTPGEASDRLEYMRYNVRPQGGYIEVEVPPFRVDILRDVDIAEDLAISIGYEELGPRPPHFDTRGRLSMETLLSRRLRSLLIGLGFTEVLQLTLTSPRILSRLAEEMLVKVANPVQEEYSVLRPSLIPGMLTVARANIHRDKPVKFFEIGVIAERSSSGITEDLRLGMAIMSDEVSYEDIQAPVYTILRLLGIGFNVKPGRHPYLMDGRTAEVMVGGETLGWMGEADPGVLEEMNIDYPIVVAELSIGVMRSRIQSQYTRSH